MKANMSGYTHRIAATCVVLVAALVLSGCIMRTAPVYNVSERQFPAVVAENLTLDEIAEAISLSGTGRMDTWNFTRTGANTMAADIAVRAHYAKVNITFDKQAFSIGYEDSRELLHTGTHIHRNYNKWIENLENDILREVTLAARG